MSKVKVTLNVNRCPVKAGVSIKLLLVGGGTRVYTKGKYHIPGTGIVASIEELNWLNVKEYEIIEGG